MSRNYFTSTRVVSLLAASVFVFQGLPAIMSANDLVSEHASKLTNLVCDVLNLFAAAIAIYLNKPQIVKKNNSK